MGRSLRAKSVLWTVSRGFTASIERLLKFGPTLTETDETDNDIHINTICVSILPQPLSDKAVLEVYHEAWFLKYIGNMFCSHLKDLERKKHISMKVSKLALRSGNLFAQYDLIKHEAINSP